MQGVVIKSTGSWYQVLTDKGELYNCRIQGKFRTQGIKTTNPVAVGDKVEIQPEPEQETAVITRLHPRTNYLIRKSVNLSKQSQILAANIDQAFLVVTLSAPATSLGFIDRFLVTAEAYGIAASILINKTDLLTAPQERELLADFSALYQEIGYPCYSISVVENTGIAALSALLQGKTTLLSGHSGVGKSSLINRLIPDSRLKVGEISGWSQRGKHTTTFAEMIPLPDKGFLIDTPGINEFGLVDMEASEIAHYFPEFRSRLNQCRFHNCVHVNEPGCAIISAVEQGAISLDRYQSYLSIYEGRDTRA